MSSAALSEFHSSSDCPTAHVSHGSPSMDGHDGSEMHSAASTRPNTSAADKTRGTTPLNSEAFASPMSRQATGTSAGFSPSPTTADLNREGNMKPEKQRPPVIKISPPIPSPSPSSNSQSLEGRSVELTQLPQPRPSDAPIKADGSGAPQSNSGHYLTNGNGATAAKGSSKPAALVRDYLTLPTITDSVEAEAPPTFFAAAAPSASLTMADASAPQQRPQPTPHVHPASKSSSPFKRVATPTTAPATRGPGGEWLRHPDETGDATTPRAHRPLPHLPPMRPPSAFLTPRNKSGSQRPNSSRTASLSSQADPTGPAAAAPLANVNTSTNAADRGWWASTHRLLANGGDKINAYLEGLVNPGAVDLATEYAQTASAQAHARRASQSQLGRETSRNTPRSARAGAVPNPHRHSRSISDSSGFDGAFDVSRRSPPAHSPTFSPRRRSMFEPYSNSLQRQESEGGANSIPLDVIMIDPAQEPFVWNDPSVAAPELRLVPRDAVNDSFANAGDVSATASDDALEEPNTYVVDLVSALRGYQSNPIEPFGHLVAAALASRSAQMPVHGFEIAAAQHNPFLVRMIVDSGTLEVSDAEAQRNVQATVDALIPASEGDLSPAIYEYLESFFKMPFVKLSHEQYALLKRSGFEYIKLMYDHQHVLPDETFHSILLNESHAMHIINLVFMIIQLLSIIFCTVTIALVLADWMTADGGAYQRYGFYTLIVFGGGWALSLIFTIYAVRSRQDETRYERQFRHADALLVPSPYVAVVPVLPIFDVLCVVTYAMALKRKNMIIGHNIVACSRLSGMFYAIWFAFPQFITQSYLNHIETQIPAEYRADWAYTLLMIAVIIQWSVALFGYVSFVFTHDSIDGLGFACFNMEHIPHMLERHNATAHILHYTMAFLLEANVYMITVVSSTLPVDAACTHYSTVCLALSTSSVFYVIIVFLVIGITEGLNVRISFSAIGLFAIQLALLVCSERLNREQCGKYRSRFFRDSFVFGYLAWGAYFVSFAIWVLLMVQWCLLRLGQINIFPRMSWPYARKDVRMCKAKPKEDKALAEPETPSTPDPDVSAGANSV